MNNQYRIDGDLVFISINRKNFVVEAIIDLSDLPLVQKLPGTFYVSEANGSFYVKMGWQTNFIRYHIQLHRYLCDAQKGYDVDHRDGNTLRNTRENLRVATRSENNQNAKTKADNTSGVKGVYLNSKTGKWYGQVRLNYKTYPTGTFDTKEDCAEAVRKLRQELHPFATNRAF